MFPYDLTFGVFDASIFKQVIDNPLIWVKDVDIKPDGRVFMSMIDGGTRLDNDDTKSRFTLRACRVKVGEPPRPGDIYRLSSYRVQHTSNGEPALIVSQMDFIRHPDEPIPHNTPPYPYQIAANELKRLGEEFRNARYRQIDQQREPPQSMQSMPRPPALSPFTSTAQCPISFPTSTSDAPQPVFNQSVPQQQQQSSNRESLYPFLSNSPNTINQPVNASTSNPYASTSNPYASTSNPYAMDCTSNVSHDFYGPVRKSPQISGGFQHGSADPHSSHPTRAAPYPPQYRSTGPVAHRTDGQYVPIRTLTAFLGRWMVKGRFVNVGEPRPYTNQRGEGRIWNLDLVDSKDDCGTIRCTMFNKAINKFLPVIKEGEIYTVTKGQIKTANKKFNSGAHGFELHLGEDAEIHWVAKDDPMIPMKNVPQIVPIKDLASMSKNTSISIIGILIRCGDISEITARSTGRPRDKRDITVVDESGTCVDVTLWGNKAHSIEQQNINLSTMPVLLIESARVDEYNGRRLSSVGQTTVTLNPLTPEGHRLRQWFDSEGYSNIGKFNSLTTSGWSDPKGESTRATIAQIKHRSTTVIPENEMEDKGAWFSCRATLTQINQERQWYWTACPICQKKVTYPAGSNDGFGLDEEITQAYCGNCKKEIDQPVKKYLLNVEIGDSTGMMSCVAIGDRGTQLMGGIAADDLFELSKKDLDPNQFKRSNDYFNCRLGRLYIFRIHSKMERYRDESVVKYRIYGLDPISGDEIEGVSTSSSNNNNDPLTLMKQQIVKDCRSTLNWIYDFIPKIAQAYNTQLNQ